MNGSDSLHFEREKAEPAPQCPKMILYKDLCDDLQFAYSSSKF